jgi:hypothetical protein
MDNRIPFHDVMSPRRRFYRTTDLGSFEYTYKSEITSVFPLTAIENLFRIRILDHEERRHFSFRPGQFVMLSVPGAGEALSPSLIAQQPRDIELCIRTAEPHRVPGTQPSGCASASAAPSAPAFP